jgi:DNA helicase II / ATP-dependent DNA helicase PcrA
MAPLDWMDVVGADAPDDDGAHGALDALLEGLNERQRDAVTHSGGPLLILAGAGSGKTRVITRRVAWLVLGGHAAPHEILAITFTNKAAREMRERIERLVPARGPWIGTFHATCARILRREIATLGSRTTDFSIYDTADRNLLLKRVLEEHGPGPPQERPALVGARISARKNGLPGAEDEWDQRFLRIAAAYDDALRRANALDFDDLLLETRRLFDEHPGTRDAYAYRFRHVLVDEYQDTNGVQYDLVRHFASAWGNLDVCGDPDQSIYAWRGADISNILGFEQDFPGARVVRLEQNYRSTPTILRAAQGVIRNNRSRPDKDLWTEREDGPPIRVLECGNENDEASAIAAEIRAELAAGRRLDGIAIFYRANFMQRAIETAMRLAGLPYRVAAGVEFYQRREIKDLIAYLHVLSNPANDIALGRILNVPARGIGDKSVDVLAAWAGARGLPLRAAIDSPEARASLRGKARNGAEDLSRVLASLSGSARSGAAEALQSVIAAVGYSAWLGDGEDPEVESRLENVDELIVTAKRYDAEAPEGGLTGFLGDVALVSEVDMLDATAPESTGQVTLMTVHAAKGLEFPLVFVAGLEEELFPHARALYSAAADGGLAIEEERRLMYVAMTRAQDRLVLSWAHQRMHFGASSSRDRSRFLREIPAECIEPDDREAEEERVLGAFDATGSTEFEIGDRVRHSHYGIGRVEKLVGSGQNARATVHFPGQGSKILLLQYANLVRVEHGR